MKKIYKAWIYTEVCKLLIILLALAPGENNTLTIIFAWVLGGLIVFTYYRAWPEFRRLTNLALIEDVWEYRQMICKAKNILIITLLLDLIPMFPFIQAIFKYYYYRLDKYVMRVY